MHEVNISPPYSEFTPPAPCSDAHCKQLETQIAELSAHIHAATYRLLELIREFDDAHGWVGPGLNTCAHWLNWKCGLSLGAAREKVRVAHALKNLPKISKVFRLGEVSYSKVRAMTRVATQMNEEFLLQIARYGTASHVERVVRNYRKVKRIEALQHENDRHAARELYWYTDDDGCLVFKGRFSPDQGMAIIKALESAMDAMYEETKDVPAGTPGDNAGAEPSPDPEPISHRRADALARVAEGYLSGSGKETGGDRYLVHVHTDMATLKADGTGAESTIDDAGNVSAETSRRLSCDAGVVNWLENNKGEALSIGHKTRSIPPAIRRALKRRDHGCRFPGCTCTRFVDAHHIIHWADGGETSMDNLVVLCRRHHRLVHEGGFGLHKKVAGQTDGQFHFTDPQGRHLPPTGDTRSRGNVFALMAGNDRGGIRITPLTGECLWDGESMDDNDAMTCMLQLE